MADDAPTSPATRTRSWSGGVQHANVEAPELPRRWAAVRRLGEGGQAEVWLAEDLELGEPVAVKLFRPDLSPASRERLRREVRIGRSLGHPGLVRVFELIEVGDRLAIVMEWVPGGSLVERLEVGPLPTSEVVTVARQTLEALAHLHERQVVHRDVKPSNLLLAADGQVKLADLGLARNLSEASDVTRTATTVGTPAYMSPEQLLGREPQPAADLYALGATLYELLTGRRPFDPAAEGPDPRLTARAPSPRRLRPDCPRWLSSFVRRLLEREPRDRFPDASRALAAFDRQRSLLLPRHRRRLVAATLVAALLAAAGAFAWERSRRVLASVTASGSEVVAIDRRGHELWHRGFPGSTPRAVTADVVADSTPEAVVALQRSAPGAPEQTPDLVVLTSDGLEVGKIASSLGELAANYPDVAPTTLGPFLDLLDLDGDGGLDVVWTTAHSRWYPTVVGGWNLRRQGLPTALFVNSGSVHDLVSAHLDGDDRPELLAVGINNPLGFQNTLVILRPRASGDERATHRPCSPDLLARWLQMGRSSPDAPPVYVPLGPHAGPASVLRSSPGGITLRIGGETRELDADGNPAGFPLFGQGRRPRTAFWEDLTTACRAIENEPARLDELRGTLDARHTHALAEPPTRVAASLLLARSAARAGRHDQAVAILAAAAQTAPDDLDLALRRGEQLAILGRVEPAEAAFRCACRVGVPGRGPLDAVVAWAYLAAWHARDIERVASTWEVSMANSRPDAFSRDVRALAAFARGEWGSPLLATTDTESVFEVAGLVRAWAALERGEDPSAVRAEAERCAADPGLAGQATVVLARTALKTGRAAQAAELAQAALAALERRGRESWEVFAWVPLAERVLGDALAAAGRPAEAAPHLARARRLAPGAWFADPSRRPRSAG